MRTATKYYILSLFLSLLAGSASGQATTASSSEGALAKFQERLNTYSQARARLATNLGELPARATPEQIEAHKKAFQKAVIRSRAGVRQGDFFTPDAARAIRGIITAAYTGEDRKRLRQDLFVAENKTVPVRANSPYPEAAEILEMPPALLLALPQLPKELRWRFVANNLLLMDSDLLLIVDYMTKALP